MLKAFTSGDITKARGSLYMRLKNGSLAGIMLPLGNAEYSRTIEEGDTVEVLSARTYNKVVVFKESDGLTGSGTVNLLSDGPIKKIFRAMGDTVTADEAAAPGQFVIDKVGEYASTIPLYARRVDNVIVSDADDDAIVYEEGVHYTVASQNGAMAFVDLIDKPAGAGPNVRVDFDRLASKGTINPLLGAAGFEAELIFVSAPHARNNYEPQTEVVRRAQCRTSNDLSRANSGTDVETVEITFEMLADDAFPDSPYGYIMSGEKWAA